jgi:curved DNA-binding protein CbpA
VEPVVVPRIESLDYYQRLGLPRTATAQAIRDAYRDLSRRYHPDTSELSPIVAQAKFQLIQEAYHVLNSPEQRLLYDLQREASPKPVETTPVQTAATVRSVGSFSELPAIDREFSGGELFSLLSLGLTLVLCLGLAIGLALARGEALMPTPSWQRPPAQTQIQIQTQTPGIEPMEVPQVEVPG